VNKPTKAFAELWCNLEEPPPATLATVRTQQIVGKKEALVVGVSALRVAEVIHATSQLRKLSPEKRMCPMRNSLAICEQGEWQIGELRRFLLVYTYKLNGRHVREERLTLRQPRRARRVRCIWLVRLTIVNSHKNRKRKSNTTGITTNSIETLARSQPLTNH